MTMRNPAGRAMIRVVMAAAVSTIVGITRAEQPASQPVAASPVTEPTAISPTTLPTTGPTTGPAVASNLSQADEIADLIRKLGDTDYHVRSDAVKRLKVFGRDALPALKAAQNSDDPEVQIRVRELLAAVEHPPAPVNPTIVSRPHSIRISVNNNARTIDAVEEARTTHIQDSTSGGPIKMTITDQVGGKPRVREFAAADADDLKKQSPEAFALYDTWANQQAMVMRGPGNAMRLQVQAHVFPAQPLNPAVLNQLRAAQGIAPGGDDLKALREKLEKQMQEINVGEEQRQQILNRIDDMLKTTRQQADAKELNQDDQKKKYLQQSDELRKAIAALKLPDPGPLLPPASGARLGISVGTAGPDANGIRVIEVLAESRAARLGVANDDVIQKINGQEIRTADDLRRAVSDHPKDLVVQVLREGKSVELKE